MLLVRAHAFNDRCIVLQRSREAKSRKYDGKLPPEIGLIPLVVSTFGTWEDDARANLREIVFHRGRNSSVNLFSLSKQFFKDFPRLSPAREWQFAFYTKPHVDNPP